jgi:hypothetical protein
MRMDWATFQAGLEARLSVNPVVNDEEATE